MMILPNAYKKPLRILWGLLFFICVGLIVGLRIGLKIKGGLQLLLFVTPFFLFGAIHLLLMYISWFNKEDRSVFSWLKKVFLVILILAYVIILIGFIVKFVLNI